MGLISSRFASLRVRHLGTIAVGNVILRSIQSSNAILSMHSQSLDRSCSCIRRMEEEEKEVVG